MSTLSCQVLLSDVVHVRRGYSEVQKKNSRAAVFVVSKLKTGRTSGRGEKEFPN